MWMTMMMMMIMMIIVNVYSALPPKTPLLRYVIRCVVKRIVFSADLKKLKLSDGSRRCVCYTTI